MLVRCSCREPEIFGTRPPSPEWDAAAHMRVRPIQYYGPRAGAGNSNVPGKGHVPLPKSTVSAAKSDPPMPSTSVCIGVEGSLP